MPITASGTETPMATFAPVVRSDDGLSDALGFAVAVWAKELVVPEEKIEGEDVEEDVVEGVVVEELVKGPNW